MKVIKLENKDLTPAVLFLKSISMKGKATRGKQKFIERLVEKNKEFLDQEKELIKPHVVLDDNDEIVIKEGNFEFKEDATADEKEILSKEREELQEEVAEISFAEYSTKYESLFKVLDDWDKDIDPNYSYIYDKLMDEYEANEEEK